MNASFENVVQDAETRCKTPQYNLILSYELPLSVIDSEFVKAYEVEASLWATAPCPHDLYFSHAEKYLGEEGLRFVMDQLQQKRASRRALLSLVSMRDLLDLDVKDKPVPALMTMQFAIEGSDTVVFAAYFRALEVSSFLPVNLAEFSLYLRRVREIFPDLRMLKLTIHAFRAYMEREFSLLRRAEIDRMDQGNVTWLTATGEFEQLLRLLRDKRRRGTVVDAGGLKGVLIGAEKASSLYDKSFYHDIQNCHVTLTRLEAIRISASEGSHIDQLWADFFESIDSVIEYLEKKIEENKR